MILIVLIYLFINFYLYFYSLICECRRTFGGKSLHDLKGQSGPNPYERAIDILGRTLAPFDDDHLIPAYGFGDITTKDMYA